jgi:hypothetical protein
MAALQIPHWQSDAVRAQSGLLLRARSSVQRKNKRTFKVEILCGCSEGFRKAARQRQTDWQTAASCLSCIIEKSALWD